MSDAPETAISSKTGKAAAMKAISMREKLAIPRMPWATFAALVLFVLGGRGAFSADLMRVGDGPFITGGGF